MSKPLRMATTGGGSGPPVYIEDVFSTFLYTGNGSTQTINNGIDLAGKGGLVWTKSRNASGSPNFYDTLRGVNTWLISNSTTASTVTAGTLTSFNSNGFSLGNSNFVNASATDFVSWTFREQPNFFDVVTYTGNGVTGRQISHNLGSTPGCVIVKRTDGTGNWLVSHRFNQSANLRLNTTAAAGGGWVYGLTSTTFTVWADAGSADSCNTNGATYVAYVFAHNAGGFGLTGTDNVISCGSYTTDASGNSTLQNLGYEPQWVMIKAATGAAEEWVINDSMRGMRANPAGSAQALIPNSISAESNYGLGVNISSNGFTGFGSASRTYIYIAIRRGPMKVPTTGTSVYNGIARTGTGAATNVTGAGFAPDYAIIRNRTTEDWVVADRLRGGAPFLATNGAGAEQTVGTYLGDATFSSTMDGIRVITAGAVNASSNSYINYLFRRAPGFFDQVCYTGTGAGNRALSHNLGVAPELIFIKSRSSASYGWPVYAAPVGNTSALYLNTTATPRSSVGYWNNTTPTATTFTVNWENDVETTGATYVAYLFASCPGVSKVGSYTGNGSSQTINCGFTGGARFVLIKRTDSTGDWYVWDTARGIVAANDPHLSLNSTAAEVTSNDSVDPVASGFAVNQVAATNINVSGASYIYLAIA